MGDGWNVFLTNKPWTISIWSPLSPPVVSPLCHPPLSHPLSPLRLLPLLLLSLCLLLSPLRYSPSTPVVPPCLFPSFCRLSALSSHHLLPLPSHISLSRIIFLSPYRLPRLPPFSFPSSLLSAPCCIVWLSLWGLHAVYVPGMSDRPDPFTKCFPLPPPSPHLTLPVIDCLYICMHLFHSDKFGMYPPPIHFLL